VYDDEVEPSPFRDLIETWLLQEMIFHAGDMGMILREIVGQHLFTSTTAKSVYRAILIGNGDFKATVHSILEDYPPRVSREFFGRLAVIKKTPKGNYRDDWTTEIDIDEALEVLRKNEPEEVIRYCWKHSLTDIGMPEWFEGEVCGYSG
jgi:hypothetical protein